MAKKSQDPFTSIALDIIYVCRHACMCVHVRAFMCVCVPTFTQEWGYDLQGSV